VSLDATMEHSSLSPQCAAKTASLLPQARVSIDRRPDIVMLAESQRTQPMTGPIAGWGEARDRAPATDYSQ